MFNFLKIFKKNASQVISQVTEEIPPIELLKESLKNFDQYKSEKEIRDEIKRRENLKLTYVSWLGYIDDILEKVDTKILDKNKSVKNGEYVSNRISISIENRDFQLYFWQMLKEAIEEKFGKDISSIYVRYVYSDDWNPYTYNNRGILDNYLEIFLNLDGLKIITFEETFAHTFNQHNIIHDFISITNYRHSESESWVEKRLNGFDIETTHTEESFKFLEESQSNV